MHHNFKIERKKQNINRILFASTVYLFLFSSFVFSKQNEKLCVKDVSVLDNFKKKEENLVKKENDLEKKKMEFQEKEKYLKQMLSEIKNERKKIEKMANRYFSEKKVRVLKLIDTVQNMSPKAAAKLFEMLDTTVVVQIMSKVPTKKLAKIMNLVSPKRSKILSEKMFYQQERSVSGKELKKETKNEL